MQLKNWTARPGGGKITIKGTDEDGVERVITGCSEIWASTRSWNERRCWYGRIETVSKNYYYAKHVDYGVITLS